MDNSVFFADNTIVKEAIWSINGGSVANYFLELAMIAGRPPFSLCSINMDITINEDAV
ncbi:MAG: hypothetical protein LBH03_04845 [Holophagales bacterium]|jgi:hypothetical protein|nr:hypothetical protein [Holophagales bacterium]